MYGMDSVISIIQCRSAVGTASGIHQDPCRVRPLQAGGWPCEGGLMIPRSLSGDGCRAGQGRAAASHNLKKEGGHRRRRGPQ